MYDPHVFDAPDSRRPLPPAALPRGAAARRPRAVEPLPAFPPRAAGPAPTGRSLGLCSNCDLRGECAFPVPEGGVWFCEEHA